MFAEGNMRPCYFRFGYDVAVPLPTWKRFYTFRNIAPQDRKYFATFKASKRKAKSVVVVVFFFFPG